MYLFCVYEFLSACVYVHHMQAFANGGQMMGSGILELEVWLWQSKEIHADKTLTTNETLEARL